MKTENGKVKTENGKLKTENGKLRKIKDKHPTALHSFLALICCQKCVVALHREKKNNGG